VDTVRSWERTLREQLHDLPGVEFENKTHTLSVHYRKARPRAPAEHRVHGAVSALAGGVRLIPGKCVINVVPDGAPHKGSALVRCARSLMLGQALYVGDDATDEDVFALPPGELAVAGVRVGLSRRSQASYYLRDQGELDALLERLVRLRA
jgi:trehalose 6-phosphate phosphatase